MTIAPKNKKDPACMCGSALPGRPNHRQGSKSVSKLKLTRRKLGRKGRGQKTESSGKCMLTQVERVKGNTHHIDHLQNNIYGIKK